LETRRAVEGARTGLRESGYGQSSSGAAPLARVWEELAGGRWALYVIYVGSAWLITQLYWQLVIELDTATLAKMVAGEAKSPFQYRVLMPFLIGIVSAANGDLPLDLADKALRVGALFGAMILLRHWLRYFVTPVLADVMPLILSAILPWSFDFYWPYDFSGLLLWTGCLVLLFERRYEWYLWLFAIATFNRETTFFLIGIFAATQWEALGRRRVLEWTGRQLMIWVLILVGLRVAIPTQEGDPLEFQFWANCVYLASGVWLCLVEHWLTLLAGAGFMWVLVPWHWRKKSLFLRRACWVLPAYAVGMLIVGRLVETRLWYEWVPIVMALAGQSLMEFWNQERKAAAAAELRG
jgi:hypothetical protein